MMRGEITDCEVLPGIFRRVEIVEGRHMQKVIGLILGLCALGYLAVSAAPDLVRDTAQRGHWSPTSEWAAEKAKCTRYSFVISHCSVSAVQRFARPAEKRSLTYLTFADWGGRAIQFVRSTKDPRVIAISHAAEGLAGRWAFLFVMIGAVAALSVVGLRMLRQGGADPALA
jgi:hypothetical protein